MRKSGPAGTCQQAPAAKSGFAPRLASNNSQRPSHTNNAEGPQIFGGDLVHFCKLCTTLFRKSLAALPLHPTRLLAGNSPRRQSVKLSVCSCPAQPWQRQTKTGSPLATVPISSSLHPTAKKREPQHTHRTYSTQKKYQIPKARTIGTRSPAFVHCNRPAQVTEPLDLALA
jgi:hypothetical protein